MVFLDPGTVVFTPGGGKHWHGAKTDSWFSHIALGVLGRTPRTSGWSRSTMRIMNVYRGGASRYVGGLHA